MKTLKLTAAEIDKTLDWLNTTVEGLSERTQPAEGVRAQLVAYEIATDPATGISFNYRKWGEAQADRDYEVIECAYGYAAGVAAAIKRITTP